MSQKAKRTKQVIEKRATMRIALIGIGHVGRALAEHWSKAGHEIWLASDRKDSPSVEEALRAHPDWKRAGVQEAVNQVDAVVLAVPFDAVSSAISGVRFGGKLLIDCTNPIGPGFTHALKSERSGSEFVQELVPDAHVVKAFNIYGYENLVQVPQDGSGRRPVMLMAGNDSGAKAVASNLIADVGFEAKDTGPLNQALHLEHMTLLWVKMVRNQGHTSHFVWAYVEQKP